MSDIVRRQMQAETEANGEIRAKDFKHTNYQDRKSVV